MNPGVDEPASEAPGRGRARARRVVLEALAEADIRGEGLELAAERLAGVPAPPPFAVALLDGVVRELDAVDAGIRERLRPDWPLERLGAVERNVLRMGVWELNFGDAPAEVVIDQAVELAKRYASERAAKLINGVLASIHRSSGGDPGRRVEDER